METECVADASTVTHPSPLSTKSFCVGRQQVSKYHEDADQANDVRVFVAVYRLRSHNTDVVLTLNGAAQVMNSRLFMFTPFCILTTSIAHGSQLNPSSSSKAAVDDQAQAAANDAATAHALFEAIVASFEILDYNLFAA